VIAAREGRILQVTLSRVAAEFKNNPAMEDAVMELVDQYDNALRLLQKRASK
jgi:hypothetical protein